IIEAMNYGAVPVVADAGAVTEVIENNVSGIVVPQDNATHDIINAIAELASNRDRLRILSQNAFNFSKDLNWDTAVDNFAKVIDEHRRKRQTTRTFRRPAYATN